MKWLKSNIVTIQAVLTNRYHIKEDNGRFGWTDDMFEEEMEDKKMDNKNITINMENLSEEEQNTLLELIKKSNEIKSKKSKVWKPKEGEGFYTIHGDGSIDELTWFNNADIIKRYELGNCFKTEKEAEFALERQKVITELKRYALEQNEKEIDWYDHCVLKYYIQYDYVNNKLNIVSTRYSKSNISSMYFTSDKIAQAAIEAIGEERIKKYYFEVNG